MNRIEFLIVIGIILIVIFGTISTLKNTAKKAIGLLVEAVIVALAQSVPG